jgi:hypothetical protein
MLREKAGVVKDENIKALWRGGAFDILSHDLSDPEQKNPFIIRA